MEVGIRKLQPKKGKCFVEIIETQQTLTSKPKREMHFRGNEQDEGTKTLEVNFYLIGDLKFVFMVLGRSGYCGSWCLYCLLKSADWCKIHKEKDSIHCGASKWTIKDLIAKTMVMDQIDGSIRTQAL